VWAFLGHVGYYRRFIHKYVGIAGPLTNLLKKELMCIDVYTWAFHELKMRLTKAPILVPPNWTKEFQVYVDASNFTIGNFLMVGKGLHPMMLFKIPCSSTTFSSIFSSTS
jgi:hypothetical protein